MGKSKVFIFIVLSFLIITVMESGAVTRTALVIGNGAYKSAPLKNPVNDAGDMAKVLTESGFKVNLKINVSHREMETAVRIFGKALRQGGIGLFYYAGHGLQLNGINYLIPVDAQIETESDVKYETIDAGRILGKMEDAGNDMNIVILDAYATAPEKLASDGDDRNGIYTKHIILNIRNPDLKIEELFKDVRMAVVKNTSKQQTPWEISSLMGAFDFKLQQSGQNNTKQTVKEKQSTESFYEIVFWESIKDSTDAESFKVYLQQFPSGVFTGLAELRIIRINQFAKKSKINKTISSIKAFPYKNRIVYDKNSSLEWIVGSSLSNLGVFPTKNWISNLNLSNGGWRLPSLKELYVLYGNKDNLTKIISLFEIKNTWVWTSSGYVFNLRLGNWNVINDTDSNMDFGFILLAVRSRK